MQPLATLIKKTERGLASGDGHQLASAVTEVLPFLKMIARQDVAPAQKCLDVMFAVLSMVHDGSAPREREALMEWARQSLRNAGIEVAPMGVSHAVIQENGDGR